MLREEPTGGSYRLPPGAEITVPAPLVGCRVADPRSARTPLAVYPCEFVSRKVGAAFHRKETATRSANQVMSHPVACASCCAELAWHRSFRLSGGCGGPHASNLSFQALAFGDAHGRRSNGRCPLRLQRLPLGLPKQYGFLRLWWSSSRFDPDNACKFIDTCRLHATTEGGRLVPRRNHLGYH